MSNVLFVVMKRRQHRGFHTWEFHDLLDCSLEIAKQEYPHSYEGGPYQLQPVRARTPEVDT